MWDWSNLDPTRTNSNVRNAFDRFGDWAAKSENTIVKPVVAGVMVAGGAVLIATGVGAPLGASLLAGGVVYYANVGNLMASGASWEEANKFAVLGASYSATIPDRPGQPNRAPVDPGAPQRSGPQIPNQSQAWNNYNTGRPDPSLTACNGCPPNQAQSSTGVRMPDFYSLNISVAIPNPFTATIVGWNGNITMDRHFQIFASPFGIGIGKSATIASASLTANWLLQTNKPTANETYSFLSGHGISIGGGFIGGGNWTISPTNTSTNNALGLGLYTPQLGASYNYTPEIFIFLKK